MLILLIIYFIVLIEQKKQIKKLEFELKKAELDVKLAEFEKINLYLKKLKLQKQIEASNLEEAQLKNELKKLEEILNDCSNNIYLNLFDINKHHILNRFDIHTVKTKSRKQYKHIFYYLLYHRLRY